MIGMLIFNMKVYAGWPAPAIQVQDMFVDPAFRQGGVGRTLLGRLAVEARRRRAVHIELVVRANSPAHRFYERAGFFAVKEAVTYVATTQTVDCLASKYEVSLR
jgi:ribosomal protein S18 acetylase RimI-like enzyme